VCLRVIQIGLTYLTVNTMAVAHNPEIRSIKLSWIALGLLIFQLIDAVIPAQAAKGLPGSSEFGFGARLDIWGLETDLAINAAIAIGLDWVAMDFDWARHWGTESAAPALERIDQVIQPAGQNGLGVLISITNPPAWARTAAGPDPGKTAALLTLLARRYPHAQLAFELFPAPNTSLGWGASPNPQAYAELLRSAYQSVGSLDQSVVLLAGGLSPIAPQGRAGDMDDLVFLEALYRAGAASFMPVIGLRLTALTGDALAPADQNGARVLRHYEAVRQVMLEHGHAQGMVWITGYHWPDSIASASVSDSTEQVRWLNQALHLMKSQLYLGVAIYDPLNPPVESHRLESSGASLIIKQADQVYLHPAVKALGRIITMLRTGQNTSYQLFLYKKITSGPAKSLLKSIQP